jgi:predicted phosphodiesterase
MNVQDWLLSERLKIAWAALPPSKRAELQPMFDAAHQQLRNFQNTGQATHKPGVPHQLLLAKSALTNDQEGLVSSLPAPEAKAVELSVDPGGSIWGTGQYQQLDPRWVEAAALWLEHILSGKFKFPDGQPIVVPMPDQVTIAMAGDWGTGDWGTAANPAASTKIRKLIAAQNADFTIHLGDVYYAGTSEEEANKLLKLWPAGSTGSFTLNSNHEMYSGATPYFTEVLGHGQFQLQSPFSFFALENSNWVVVGLDSAYYGDENALYQDGALDAAAQIPFLQAQAQKGKKVIVLTHHNGLAEDGSIPAAGTAQSRLWNDVMQAFQGSPPPAYWYWGHVHTGVVYNPVNGILCRCAGHGALPWATASELQNNPNVAWVEKRLANDPDDTLRLCNGFAVLSLAGANISETFYDENGQVAWTSEGSSESSASAAS